MKTNQVLFSVLTGLFLSTGVFAQYEIGDKVQDFKLKSTSGEYVSLEDYEDAKGYIVVFTCNTCPFVHKYEERIIALDKKFASKAYPVVAINPNSVKKSPGDSMDAMKKRAADKSYSFAYLRDDDQQVAKRFGAERTPEIYLLEKKEDGLYLVYTGTIDNNVNDPSKADEHYVSDAINALISGKDVSIAETKAIGCTIKWN